MEADKLIDQLSSVGTLRVWSLLTTVLGDLSASHNQSIPGPWLNQVFQTMGVSAEAFRVAVHRLKKDGWVESSKEGRNSYYALSDIALAETNRVWDSVYNTRPEDSDSWCVTIVDSNAATINQRFIKLTHSVFAIRCVEKPKSTADALLFDWQDQALPDWLRNSDLFLPVVDTGMALTSILSKTNLSLIAANDVQRAAIRFLILHHWRKIALRDAAWIHMRHVPNSSLSECHDLVKTALTTLQVKPTDLRANS